MRDRRDIRARREQGGTIRGIARDIGADRNTIRRAIDPDANLDYRRPTLADEYEPAVRDVLGDYPRLTVQQVAEIIEWPASRRSLSDLVARIRPIVLDREREDLIRPQAGTLTVGTIRIGTATAGAPTVGRLHDFQEAARGSLRTA